MSIFNNAFHKIWRILPYNSLDNSIFRRTKMNILNFARIFVNNSKSKTHILTKVTFPTRPKESKGRLIS